MLKIKNRRDNTEQPYPLDEYLAQDNPEVCENCDDVLATHYRKPGRYAKPHLDRYIQRHMKNVFDLGIFDEVHELAAADSAQGNAFGTLAGACKYAIALTGTLIGGKAHDLHAPLWRMSPELLRQRGFILHPNPKSQRSAIGRNERAFIRRYGVLETRITRSLDGGNGRVTYGSRSRRKMSKSEEFVKPGISPDLFNHYLLGNAVFMSLSELGPALPTLTRELVSCEPEPELAAAYKFVDKAFQDAKSNYGPLAPTLGALRVQVLDAYLDRPWGWHTVMAPVFENGTKNWIKITQPPDLGEHHEDSKDSKLLELVQAELAQGRKCAIAVNYTGEHNVRPKLSAMFERAGIRMMWLPDKIKSSEREQWIIEHEHLMDVFGSHPKRTMTGMDLIWFPSQFWYQCGLSTHVLRQWSARARRPTQTLPCKLFYCYYRGTVQEWAMNLMSEKEAASLALEGTFDLNALRGLMNGGQNDDILAALASNLGKEHDAKIAWQKVIEADIQPTAEDHELYVFDLEEELVFA
jgi:hypothetical protein